MQFVFNLVAEEFVPKVEEEHGYSGEHNACSLGRGEAGHHVGKQTPRQRGRECRGWDGLGRLNPAIGNEDMHRAKKTESLPTSKEKYEKKQEKDEGVGPSVSWQGLQHARLERDRRRHLWW